MPTIRKTDETIIVTIPLDAEDIKEIQQELIELNNARNFALFHVETLKCKINATKKKVETLTADISFQIERLKENDKSVTLDCIKATNYDDGLVTFVRKDTGEIVKERALADDERQMPLEFGVAATDAEDLEQADDVIAEDHAGAEDDPAPEAA